MSAAPLEDHAALPGRVLVVCGIDAEATLFTPFAQTVLTSGGRVDRLRAALHSEGAHASAVVSVGLAGGLDPALRTGDLIVARFVTDGESTFATDVAWTDDLAELTGGAVVERAFGCDSVASAPAAKADLFATTGAAVVDMESHIAARWACAQGVPFAVMRVVSDDAAHGLPASAVAGMGEDGKVKVGRVLQGLLRRPAELPALIRTGADVGVAMAALKRAAAAAGVCVGLPEDRIFMRPGGGGD